MESDASMLVEPPQRPGETTDRHVIRRNIQGLLRAIQHEYVAPSIYIGTGVVLTAWGARCLLRMNRFLSMRTLPTRSGGPTAWRTVWPPSSVWCWGDLSCPSSPLASSMS
mmetsp:Transcript_42476/g.106031  ORF Transcript_42476/g.106031 Transcript_42476/m.106031 type:complete len:110 (+) Transcript_42476:1410-1739(+)